LDQKPLSKYPPSTPPSEGPSHHDMRPLISYLIDNRNLSIISSPTNDILLGPFIKYNAFAFYFIRFYKSEIHIDNPLDLELAIEANKNVGIDI